ncbi:MAG TPA: hypothetical protein ENI73_05755 [Spirochaetes bacterium]|nr:hypothetical protein [Spirochaetota bacterium]
MGSKTYILKKILSYLKSFWKEILGSIIFGSSTAFWILPEILDKKIVQRFFLLDLSPTLVLLVLIGFLFLSFFFRPFLSFFIRWKRNLSFTNPPFTFFDGICLSLGSLILSTTVSKAFLLKDLEVSTEMKWLLWVFSGYLVCWILWVIKKAKSPETKTETARSTIPGDTHFPDDPISDESEDLLGREGFIDALYRQVSTYPFSDSFVFGLYGRWGEGKTSVLNLLKKRLNEDKNNIVFEFDPWNYPSEEALVKGYYSGLYRVFNERYFLPNFKKLLGRYQKTLNSGLKLAGVNFEILSSIVSRDDSLDDLRREINNLIASTKKKVIVIIDNIDRLQDKAELHQVFKLAKLSARFRNTIFILSFDPLVVKEFFKNEISSDSDFLAKIVQAPIHLPSIDQAHIRKFLYYSTPDENYLSGIDRLFQHLKIKGEKVKTFEGVFNSIFEVHIEKYFTTLRDAKRYLNRLYQNLPAIMNEVDLSDFFILELIGIFHPKVYADIWTNPGYYIPVWGIKAYSSPFSYSFSYEDENKKNEQITKHLLELLKNEPRSESLRALLCRLFIQVKIALKESFPNRRGLDPETTLLDQRITNPEVFPKYFMLKTPTSDIPDETISTIITDWNQRGLSDCESRFLENFEKFKKEKKATKFLDKLLNSMTLFNAVTTQAVVSAIYKNISCFSDDRGGDLFASEFGKAEKLMIHLFNDYHPADLVEKDLLKIVQETSSLKLAVLVVHVCDRSNKSGFDRIFENADIKKLQQNLSLRLCQFFIEENRDIFEEEPESYFLILTQWGNYSQKDKEKVNDYVFALIEKNTRYIGKIIKGYCRFGDQTRYDDLIKLYDDNRFYEKIKANTENCFSDKDEKKAIDLFVQVYEERRASLGS